MVHGLSFSFLACLPLCSFFFFTVSIICILLNLISWINWPSQFVSSSSHVPRWLQVLLTEKFYNVCIIHEEAKKNEKNVYCLDCCISLCPHCLSPHRSHRLLQVLLSKFFFTKRCKQLQTCFHLINLTIFYLIFFICSLLQIRRYVYHDVIRLDDAAKLIDCNSVQVSFFFFFFSFCFLSIFDWEFSLCFLPRARIDILTLDQGLW